MKDRHINIDADSRILKQLHEEVNANLKKDRVKTAVLLMIKFVVYVSALLFFYALIILSQDVIVFLAAFTGFGLCSVLFGFNFAHDFSHNSVFKNKRLNNLGFITIYTLVGAHAEAWKFRHIHSHHYAPNVQHYDSDLQITTLIRVEPESDYRWFHKYQHWYASLAYTSYSLYWVLIKDFVIYYTDKEYPKKKTIAYHLSFWFQKAAYFTCLLVIPLLYSAHAWYLTVIAFIIMHLIQSLFLLFTFFITHHVEKTEYYKADDNGYIQTSWMTNQVKSSNDFYPFSQVANFIFGGFNNHIAHHLFPHIHHVHYPGMNKILYRVLRENNIEPNVTGFFGGIRSHLKHLKKMSVPPANTKAIRSGGPLFHYFVQNNPGSH